MQASRDRAGGGETRARPLARRVLLALSFLLVFVVPSALSGWYLWMRAAPQYTSNLGVALRSAVARAGTDTGPGLGANQTDILYAFMTSQPLITDMDAALDLGALWSRPRTDPVFALAPDAPLEDLIAYWPRMVTITHDRAGRLIKAQVRAFDPDDATRIAQALYESGATLVETMGNDAHDDLVAALRDERVLLDERLAVARETLDAYRARHQLSDPAKGAAQRALFMAALQAQRADAMIAMALLAQEAPGDDAGVAAAARRLAVIENHIASEEQAQAAELESVDADIRAEHARLIANLEAAQSAVGMAAATHDITLAEARRRSPQLSAFIAPTRAETARFPDRWRLMGQAMLAAFLAWIAVALGVIAVTRGRRHRG